MSILVRTFLALTGLLSVHIVGTVGVHAETPTGFQSIFNGKDLTGWEGNEAFFRVEPGAVVAGRLNAPIPNNEFLCTEVEYDDFELRLQVKASSEHINGGIQIRSQRIPNHHEMKGYQVDVGSAPVAMMRAMSEPDDFARADMPDEGMATIWGSLYDESRRNRFLATGNQAKLSGKVSPTEWNDFVIRCEGPRIQVWVNGVQTVDYTETDETVPLNGIIGLQIHSGPAVEIGYRNISIRELSPSARAGTRPNILWIVVEDMSQHFSYAGESTIETPQVDRLAAEGVVFERAYVTAPVCSPSRSAMVTGMYQTTINAHHHRSFRGEIKQDLPSPVRTVPELFKEAGYYVSNGRDASGAREGKQDYNFEVPEDLYDGADWSGRAEGQPFFAQLQLRGGKRRDARVDNPVKPEDVTLPPYYPDDPVLREDWARYLDSVLYVDHEVGKIMQRLDEEGIADNTVVIFITDHGVSHARGKQFLYEEGALIPFVVWAPGRVETGTTREDFVAHIDMAATSLQFAGIEIPEWMEARPLFGPDAEPREYVVSARDRCDETVERMRSVRHGKYNYIRNYYPQRPHLQPNRYKDNKPILQRMRELYEAGELAGHPAERLYATPRPEEELYDLEADPWELNNLAGDPEYAEELETMRGLLAEWIEATGDRGQQPEPEAVYDSDMALYLRKSDGHVVQRNIDTMKAWAAEGK